LFSHDYFQGSSMSDIYELQLETAQVKEMQEFARKCVRFYRRNGIKWYKHFQGGINGFYARMSAFEEHYRLLYSWHRKHINTSHIIESHVACVFFNMVSSLECFTYTLNSLGYAVEASLFWDINDSNTLRNISTRNIYPNSRNTRIGYKKYFCKFRNLIITNKDIIDLVFELHYISKHRRMIPGYSIIRLSCSR
jgi:hypothetical protein